MSTVADADNAKLKKKCFFKFRILLAGCSNYGVVKKYCQLLLMTILQRIVAI